MAVVDQLLSVRQVEERLARTEDPRQRAMLDFALKVSTMSYAVSDADFEALHAHGFSDDDIWDISAIAAFFALSNRMANAAGMMPNPEFYLMGRVPREKKAG